MRKIILAVLALGLASIAQAHDEGHGPKLTANEAHPMNIGAAVAPVIAKNDESKVLHKAELVRKDGAAQLYLYDQSGKTATDLSAFDKSANGTLWSGAKNSRKKAEFTLQQKGGAFVGSLPKASPPYTVEVTLKKGNQALLTAFSNLE